MTPFLMGLVIGVIIGIVITIVIEFFVVLHEQSNKVLDDLE